MGVQTARAMWGCAMMFALGAAGLYDPALVHADAPHCMQWVFDGYTQFDHANGSKLKFIAFMERNFRDTPAKIVPGNGGQAIDRLVSADIVNGDRIYLDLYQFSGAPRAFYEGGVADDGFAYGIVYDDSNHTSGSWRSAAPLRCAD